MSAHKRGGQMKLRRRRLDGVRRPDGSHKFASAIGEAAGDRAFLRFSKWQRLPLFGDADPGAAGDGLRGLVSGSRGRKAQEASCGAFGSPSRSVEGMFPQGGNHHSRRGGAGLGLFPTLTLTRLLSMPHDTSLLELRSLNHAGNKERLLVEKNRGK
jgi:hypothetical protein